MTPPCALLQRGSVELFFYDELDAVTRTEMTAHFRECIDCAAALEDLKVIREVLAARPDVSAPPTGDWSSFMRRLDGAVRRSTSLQGRLKPASTSYVGLLATAALLAIVLMGVYIASRGASSPVVHPPNVGADGGSTPVATSGMKAVGVQHFERSKLVVLGLASKEAGETPTADWAYERELATSLLKDTRLYRLAAEERGLTSLAGVMRDLELVLLETSMAERTDQKALGQIQRIIEKRGLIEKMDAVPTVGM
jgi:hypothetical protein